MSNVSEIIYIKGAKAQGYITIKDPAILSVESLDAKVFGVTPPSLLQLSLTIEDAIALRDKLSLFLEEHPL